MINLNEEELINNINIVLNDLDTLCDDELIKKIIDNIELFKLFQEKLNILLEKYLIKRKNDKKQSEISEKLKICFIKIIEKQKIFGKIQELQDIVLLIINNLAHYENRLIFRVRHSTEIEMIFECLEYQKNREEYIKIIERNSISQDKRLNKVLNNYENLSYERILFENVIRILKTNIDKISTEDITQIIKKIDSTLYIKNIIDKREENLQEEDKKTLKLYAKTMIPIKAEKNIEMLKEDELVKAFLDGRIMEDKLSLIVANAIPVNEFEKLLFSIGVESKSKLIDDIEMKALEPSEQMVVDEMFEKAGIKIYTKNKYVEDDNNCLVTLEDLKKFYSEIQVDELYNTREELYKLSLQESKNKIKLTNEQKRTYREVSDIIKMMTRKMREKVNSQIIEFIERNRDDKKKSSINPNVKLKEQKIDRKTKVILALIYRDYICADEERKKILEEEKIKLEKSAKEKQEKKSPLLHKKIIEIQNRICKKKKM